MVVALLVVVDVLVLFGFLEISYFIHIHTLNICFKKVVSSRSIYIVYR